MQSCTTSYTAFLNNAGINNEEVIDLFATIPYQSNKIETNYSNGYDAIYNLLLNNNYRIETADADHGYISCSSVYGDVTIRLNVVCNDTQTSFTGEYLLGSSSTNFSSYMLGVPMTSSWNTIIWTRYNSTQTSIDKPSMIYLKMADVAYQLNKNLIFTFK